jgi:hypothetical protein
METEAGQKAIVEFVQAWAASIAPPQIAAPAQS